MPRQGHLQYRKEVQVSVTKKKTPVITPIVFDPPESEKEELNRLAHIKSPTNPPGDKMLIEEALKTDIVPFIWEEWEEADPAHVDEFLEFIRAKQCRKIKHRKSPFTKTFLAKKRKELLAFLEENKLWFGALYGYLFNRFSFLPELKRNPGPKRCKVNE